MRELFTYIRRNVFLSARSVFFSIRHYSWFIAALMIIQCFFCTMTIAAFNNNEVSYKVISEEYDYHLIIRNANETQYYVLLNDNSTHFKSSRFYQIIRSVRKGPQNAVDPVYDLYVSFNFDANESYGRFMKHYGSILTDSGNRDLVMEKTPLLDFSSYRRTNTVYYLEAFALLCVLGIAILYALYYIRTGYFRFTYGIFMTFGGGYRKIYSTSFWEMMIAALLAVIPACVISTELLRAFYSARGVALNVHASAYFISLAVSLVISALALIVPCRRISRRTPISNIIAGDNSDKVVPPRNSSEFWHVDIPKKYAAVSAWRFRRHNGLLAASSALFTAAFVLIFYGTSLYCQATSAEKPEFIIEFTDNSYDNANAEKKNRERMEALVPKAPETEEADTDEADTAEVTDESEYDGDTEETGESTDTAEETEEPSPEEFRGAVGEYLGAIPMKPNFSFTAEMEKEILSLDGVAKVRRESPPLNMSLVYHMLVGERSIEDKFEYDPYPGDNSYGIYTAVDFRPYNWDGIRTFFHSDYTGDIYEMPEGYAVVTNTVNGRKVFDFKPGDTIRVATFLGVKPGAPEPENSDSLKELLAYYNFEYTDLTVYGVVDEFENSSSPALYISEDLYEQICGAQNEYYITQSGTCRKAEVYVDDSLSPEEINAMEARLSEMLAVYGNAFVSANHAGTQRQISVSRGSDVVFYSVAVLTAVIAPLIIMFSQTMFGLKREGEFDVITALGLKRKKVFAILMTESAIQSALSVAAYLTAVFAGGLILRSRMSALLGVKLTGDIPAVPAAAGAVLLILPNLLCAVISYLSFLRGHRNSYRINLNI